MNDVDRVTNQAAVSWSFIKVSKIPRVFLEFTIQKNCIDTAISRCQRDARFTILSYGLYRNRTCLNVAHK